MKKKYLCIKSLVIFFTCILLISCEEKSEEIEYFPFTKVSKCERDSIRTTLTYDSDNRLSAFDKYVNDSYVYGASIRYGSGSISCTIGELIYNIQLSNTRGGIRAESIRVTTLSNSLLYFLEYEYDDEGRIRLVRLNGIGDQPAYCIYTYEGNTIFINDNGNDYKIELSSEENSGYVCNVLDFAEAPITSQYIINPDLYFLNIYGTPIKYLPVGHEVKRYSNRNLSHVGKKYYYEY